MNFKTEIIMTKNQGNETKFLSECACSFKSPNYLLFLFILV